MNTESLDKKLVGTVEQNEHTYTVYLVNGDYVKGKWEMDFVDAGNYKRFFGFIPEGEIWLDKHVDKSEHPYNLYHEIHECELMREGLSYSESHFRANGTEHFLRRFFPNKKRG
jgi:hypothetical protein